MADEDQNLDDQDLEPGVDEDGQEPAAGDAGTNDGQGAPDDQGAGDDDLDLEGDPDKLGDKGKKALDDMKSKWRSERKAAREANQELQKLRREKELADKSDDEKAIETARAEARNEAMSEANSRLIRSEARAAASGKLADPSLITKLGDLDDIEVDDDGNVDTDALAEAIDNVLESYPSLAAQRSNPGKFDSARGKKRPGKKYTRDDLKSMSTAQVAKAYDDGLVEL